MKLPTTPEMERIRAESKALSAALGCVGFGLTDTAKRIIEFAYQVCEESTPEELVIKCAMKRVLGGNVSVDDGDFAPTSGPIDQNMFEVASKAWVTWASDPSEEDRLAALQSLQALPLPRGAHVEGRAISVMVLRPWVLAIRALLEDNPTEARRQFRRAVEVGGQHGTESNPAIQWTYAATFITSAG